MYQETDESFAYLKGHTVRKLVRLMKYMSLLIRQDGPDALTEFRQPLKVKSHLEMPGILVQLGHTQRT